MGTHFNDWADASGAIYMGFGTNMPMIWTAVAAGLCVIALIVGSLHELRSYRRLNERLPQNQHHN